ncbi:apolipoprotein N-acyltransferase [Helicobacter enhydrae]|uniref:Apolipoprotein N-acyltransferase n=1 Tax=Helicobacter enhydrae TaxID=222136 RepID=A0A1B1U7G4_9HELI|nr:apolipoprotein N-acyltransferase [Helicobacter enhydrae]ANV98615.1 apolipoprotein N-acyltransferase [Helicobacter enhydrae]
MKEVFGDFLTRRIGEVYLAFVFVLPLYLVWLFEFHLPPLLGTFQTQNILYFLNTCFGLISFYVFLTLPSRSAWGFGFWVGLLSFYWVGYSFVYFGFSYLVIPIALFVASVYMVILRCALWFEHIILRSVALLSLSYIHPFEFDWFVPDSLFAYSFVGVHKWQLVLVVCGLMIWKSNRDFWRFVAIVPLCLALELPKDKSHLFDNAIAVSTHISQDIKWQRQNAQALAQENFLQIVNALRQKKTLIVLPETAFPFVLKLSPYYELIRDLSQEATIVVGAMSSRNDRVYNSTYVFQNKKVQIFDKVVLAPFGEKIPLPDFLSSLLRKVFLDTEAPPFDVGKTFGYFEYQGTPIKSLICYEGTSSAAYQDAPQFLVVISNNAWFPDSIEPALQKNLMKYYARLYGSTILHSSNGSPSFVLYP